MKNVMIDYDTTSVRWMGYHTALKKFFESVVGLPNVPENEDSKFGKNVKIVYATPSSAFKKYVIPMVNGVTQFPIITFYLSEETTSKEVPGAHSLINNFYFKKDDGGYDKISFTRPLMKELRYTCNIYTTTMSDCDYLLTLLECNSNEYTPYYCRVNNKPTQFYMENVETGTPTDYDGKKFIHSTFSFRVPLAMVFPTEVETDSAVIERINTYLSGETDTLE